MEVRLPEEWGEQPTHATDETEAAAAASLYLLAPNFVILSSPQQEPRRRRPCRAREHLPHEVLHPLESAHRLVPPWVKATSRVDHVLVRRGGLDGAMTWGMPKADVLRDPPPRENTQERAHVCTRVAYIQDL